MKSLVTKDRLNHERYYKLESTRLFYRALSSSYFLPPSLRLSAARKLWSLSKYGSRSIINKRCFVTNKGNSLNYKLGYSRSMLKNLIAEGKITRAKKRSW